MGGRALCADSVSSGAHAPRRRPASHVIQMCNMSNHGRSPNSGPESCSDDGPPTGLITTRQLLRLGLTHQAIRRRVKSGALVRVAQGLYRSAQAPQDWDQLALGAQMLNGPSCALSHSSAAQVWRFDVPKRIANQVEVTIPHQRRGRTLRGQVVAHRSRVFRSADRTSTGGHVVTTAVRTILDLAPRLNREELERCVEGAIGGRRVRLADLIEAVDKSKGKSTRQLAEVLQAYRDEPQPESPAEARFVRLLVESGIEPPSRQYEIFDGTSFVARVDFAWPEKRLVLEIDSYIHHESPKARARDSRRATRIRALIWNYMSVTPTQFTEEAEAVIAAVRAQLELQSAAASRR